MRNLLRFCSVGVWAILWVTSVAFAQGVPGSTPTPPAPGQSPASPPLPPTSTTRSPEIMFLDLDKNHDGVITENEITDSDRSRYFGQFGRLLSETDLNHDGRITREEFMHAGELPFYSDIHTVAGLLLLGAFAGFCFFLDGLLDPDRREYLWYALTGSLLSVGLAYLCAPEWFLRREPFLGFVSVAPVILILLALATGATRAKEEEPDTPKGTVVYKIGEKGSASVASKQRPAQPPQAGQPARRPAQAPARPRPAPTPPRLPPRPPQSSPSKPPPRPPGPPKPGGQK